jgi:hypothetical protein
MGDWNEWNELKGLIAPDDEYINETDENGGGKDKLRDVLNEPNKYVYKKKVNKVMKRITMYSTGGFGNNIVNPMDNTMYNMRVGSKDELNFFSVRFTAQSFIGKEKDIITLYYETPYAYERHHHITLPLNVIKKWEETRIKPNPVENIPNHIQIK